MPYFHFRCVAHATFDRNLIHSAEACFLVMACVGYSHAKLKTLSSLLKRLFLTRKYFPKLSFKAQKSNLFSWLLVNYDTPRMQKYKSIPGGGVGTPYLGHMGTCRWTGYGFLASLSLTGYTIWLASVLNSFKTCPKQGMVLQAERLKPRLRAVSFFSSPVTWALREVERACDWAADKQHDAFLFRICIISTE